MKSSTRQAARARRHNRIRRKIAGTAERPRMAVMISNRYMYVQVIDDDAGHTLASASTRGVGPGNTVEKAKDLGAQIAEAARDKGVQTVVFDRGGFKYHGRVKAINDAARENGLKI